MVKQHQNSRTTTQSSKLRVLVALIVGAVIGIEREHRTRAAGLRTNMLVLYEWFRRQHPAGIGPEESYENE